MCFFEPKPLKRLRAVVKKKKKINTSIGIWWIAGMSQTFQPSSMQTRCWFGGVRPDCSLSSNCGFFFFSLVFGHEAQLTGGQLQDFNFAALRLLFWPLFRLSCRYDCPSLPAGCTTTPLARQQAANPPSNQTAVIRFGLESNYRRRLRVSWCRVLCLL